MLTKIENKVEFKPKVAQQNEMLCPTCGGIGWLHDAEGGYIEKCRDCYNGIINLCERCHKPIKGMCMDKECIETRDREAEEKRFASAIKCDYDDVPDECKIMLYSETYPYNEGYFSDLDDLIEYCLDNEVNIPKYVWSTDKLKLSIDADWVLETATSELHEDACDNIVDIDGLQKFLDEWCEKQSGVDSFCVDYKYAIYFLQ